MNNTELQETAMPEKMGFKAKIVKKFSDVINQNASPHSIALGLALGIFIGFLPIMGIQMAVVLLFALPFKNANKPAAVAGVWVSNPLTVIPIYAFIYWVGMFFYPGKAILGSYGEFKSRFSEILSLDSALEQTKAFIGLGADIFLPMCIGGAFVGIIAGILTYFITKKVVIIKQSKKTI